MGEIPLAAIKAGLTLVVLAVLIGWMVLDHRRNRPDGEEHGRGRQ